MPRNYYIIDGKEDKDLTSVGLWFALTYLYSANGHPEEDRYKNAVKTLSYRIRVIKKCGADQIKSWIKYALNELNKDTKNLGKVSLSKQKEFAKELNALSEIKIESDEQK